MLLTLRRLFKLPLRQIKRLGKSLFELTDIKLEIPEFSGLSKRCSKALSRVSLQALQESSYIIIDSTGLKVYGESEWLEGNSIKGKYGVSYIWQLIQKVLSYLR